MFLYLMITNDLGDPNKIQRRHQVNVLWAQLLKAFLRFISSG